MSESTGKKRGRRAAMDAAGMGLALLGASTAGASDKYAGNSYQHSDHGHSLARWVGVAVSLLGFLIGGVGLPLGILPLVYVGAALQIVALVCAAALNRAGHGRPDEWGRLKAEAAAARQAG